MRKIIRVVLVVMTLAFLSSCAGANTAESDDGAGFWRGLAHGLIAPITFVVAIFDDDVEMYEVHTNGGWYNFGFLFGLSCWGGGGGHAATRARRRRDR
jgi:hypothetical protein